MNVINPNDTTHIIDVIPRFLPIGAVVFTLKNKIKDTETDITNTYMYANGYLTMSFDLDVLEDTTYVFKLVSDGRVIYRGSIFCTSQVPQDYKN